MTEKITLSNIAFVIVLYKKQLSKSETFNALNAFNIEDRQKINLIIYDNSPESQVVFNSKKIEIINYYHDSSNPGVSKAYNEGTAIAKNKGFKWIVLLDQDTVFAVDYVAKLTDAINRNVSIKLFAPFLKLKDGTPFSPSKYKFKRGTPVKLNSKVLSLNKYSPVNSGMAINIKAFFEVGGYLEQITLDFADFQFIEKFRKKYPLFYLFKSIAIQDFSNDETDLKKLKNRFSIFCYCAKNCIRYSYLDNLQYLYTVLRHTTGLYLKTGSLSFFKIAYFNYFKKN